MMIVRHAEQIIIRIQTFKGKGLKVLSYFTTGRGGLVIYTMLVHLKGAPMSNRTSEGPIAAMVNSALPIIT